MERPARRSLFGWIARYAGGENQLTAALAATLDRHPAAARALVQGWFPAMGTSDSVALTPQRPAGGGLVDLEIRFGSELVVWIEAKEGSRVDVEQLRRYAEAIKKEGTKTKKLVLLTRVGVGCPPGSPAGLLHCDWQSIGSDLSAFASRGDATSFASELVGEFLRYLEEKRLAVIEPLSGELAIAATWREAVTPVLGRLCELADERVRSGWGRPWRPRGHEWESVSVRREGFDRWYTFRPTDPNYSGDQYAWPKGLWFEWHLRPDYLRSDPVGANVFGASVTAPLDHDFWEADRGQLEALQKADQPFELVESLQDGSRYLIRYLAVTDLVREPDDDLEAQADRLADWILGTFRELAKRQPVGPTR